ncbi:MAG: CHASE2 domain-containing protein [Vicinamibacterales bacterium]
MAVAAVLATVATSLAVMANRLPLFQTVDWKLYDQHLRFRADPARANPRMLIVNIDERSLRAMEPLVGRWPWPRLVHANLIRYLARGGARVVAYDVLFTERDRRTGFDVNGDTWSGQDSDLEFARAVGEAANVVMLADVTSETRLSPSTEPTGHPSAPAGDPQLRDDSTFEVRPDLLLPYDELARASASLGHNYTVLDADGPLRRAVPFVKHEGALFPSLEMAAILQAERIDPRQIRWEDDLLRVGDRHLPLTTERLPQFAGAPGAPTFSRRLLIDYAGPPVLADGRSTVYKEYSFWDLFYSEEQLLAGERPEVDPSAFRDAYVFVGVGAAGLHDVFASPFSGAGRFSGAEFRASVADQILAGRFITPAPWWATSLTALATATLASLCWLSFRIRVAVLLFAGLGLALVTCSLGLFARGTWLSLTAPLIALFAGGGSGLTYQYFVEGREKRAVKRLFSRYLSKDVYEQVLANPALAELGGTRREMSVLFSDIRGFTAVTERGVPEELVAQLNEYFTRMVDVVFAHRGTLDKFVGDMVMALFGAPLDDPQHADHAVQTALAMVDELDRLNAKWAREGKPRLGIGIGINSGDMIAGNIGSEQIRSYTVIGDNVNLGARLESLNKDYKTSIIISEYTAKRLEGRYGLRPLGDVVVKGKSVSVSIYEVLPGTPPVDASTGS